MYSLFIVLPVVCVRSLFRHAILSSFEIISLGKRDSVALLLLSSRCNVANIVLGLVLMVS